MTLHKRNDRIWQPMKSDCSKCSGLCCVSLFFSKADGFPKNKKAGEPCINLLEDHRCKIHADLEAKRMRGCIGYDCFGAGQQVTGNIYEGKSWRDFPEKSAEIFDVFTTLFQIHQIRYYLTEASLLTFTESLANDIEALLNENMQISNNSPENILSFCLEDYRNRANVILKQVCRLSQEFTNKTSQVCPTDFLGKRFKGKNLSGQDLSMKLLIAADFSDCNFTGSILLGADTRDTIFNGADLSEAIFLTQGQINAAKGNRNTKIPAHLEYPITWK